MRFFFVWEGVGGGFGFYCTRKTGRGKIVPEFPLSLFVFPTFCLGIGEVLVRQTEVALLEVLPPQSIPALGPLDHQAEEEDDAR